MAQKRENAMMLRLTVLEELTLRHASELAGEPPSTWARRELLRVANGALRRAERLPAPEVAT